MPTGLTKQEQEALMGIADNDVHTIIEKSLYYGDSWKKRGGVGAFMMAARKWDRYQNMCEEVNWDTFNPADRKALLEEIGDLRRYLLLIEGEICRLMLAEEQYNHYGSGPQKPGTANDPECRIPSMPSAPGHENTPDSKPICGKLICGQKPNPNEGLHRI